MTQENTIQGLPEDFGDNGWLVDELYDQYKTDPESVDASWLPYFEKLKAEGKTPSEASPAQLGVSASSSKTSTTASTPSTSASPSQTPQDSPTQNTDTSPTAPSETPQTSQSHSPQASVAPAATSTTQASSTPAPSNNPAATSPLQTPQPSSQSEPNTEVAEAKETSVAPLRGPAKAIATNMEQSLTVPTATTVRAVPAKLMIDNRVTINNYLERTQNKKISFTHVIAYAMVQAIKAQPTMNVIYSDDDGKPSAVSPAHINLGIAIDLPRPDGTRLLVVPNIKKAETLNFQEFLDAFNDLIQRGRNGKLTPADYADTTVSITNPGGTGTNLSVPRLSKGQACILGVGSLEYPAPFQGANEDILIRDGVGKIVTLTSTYDHRVIQGAGSGEFLAYMHGLLLGENDFYTNIFKDLKIPYEPIRWASDKYVNSHQGLGKEARIHQLIDAFRTRGHLIADTNPIEYSMNTHPDLDMENYDLTLWDLDRTWPTAGFAGKDHATGSQILDALHQSYAGTTGYEFMYIEDPQERKWFQDKLEHPQEKPSKQQQLRLADRLNAAEAFETYLQTKFVGQKRFSLEGSESLIPLLDEVLANAADNNLDEVAIGMAHRGRLNVLTNIAGKELSQVFREFEGATPGGIHGSGDVKYHLGSKGNYTSDNGNSTAVSVAANPSHLEAINPVLEGITRAKQDVLDPDSQSHPVLPVLIHGDAAMAGQGIVAETFNMSQLDGYTTGGTVHIVINNQVGFTTKPSSSRSSTYATDIAKTVQAPVLHVNGDDPEAVARASKLAFDYRQEFNKDVVIDLISYRVRGHNEGDDPSMTQPTMYATIDHKPSTSTQYRNKLLSRGDISEEEAHQITEDFQKKLETAFATPIENSNDSSSQNTPPAAPSVEQQTAISPQTLARVGQVHAEVPENFTVHPKLEQLLERRQKMGTDGGIDWGFGEMAAFGSLLQEGVPVRVSGQDSRRGTFVQRHAVFHDATNDQEWTPVDHMSQDQKQLDIYDSSLSEYAILGFEYGYSVERDDALVIWEAQFGDFANGAQTIMDEFISSAEQKWDQQSSVVLLLPHGYEGQGPDHSSGRIERALQLAAENNMIISQPSTPANYFHLLRQQAYQRPRKPLVVYTPKQLLRLKAAASSVEDFTQGNFQPVIGDTTLNPSDVQTVVFVSGRLYYDLLAERSKNNNTTVALIRVEQLYPFPTQAIREELDKYPHAQKIIWAQDEPANQGAAPYMRQEFADVLNTNISVVSRPAAASPATGSGKKHTQENQQLLGNIFSS